jgi:hypothetical protein
VVVRVENKKETVFNIHGSFVDITVDVGSDNKKDQYVRLEEIRYGGQYVEISGVTVHDLVQKVLKGCSLRMKTVIRDWLTKQIEEEPEDE